VSVCDVSSSTLLCKYLGLIILRTCKNNSKILNLLKTHARTLSLKQGINPLENMADCSLTPLKVNYSVAF
jgi:hypothetical protein